MYSFLVLGIIPGTNIQITFQAWMLLFSLVSVGVLLVKLLRLQFDMDTYGDTSALRAPLHASQLHSRILSV